MDKKKQQLIIGIAIAIFVAIIAYSIISHEPRGIDHVTDEASGTYDPNVGPSDDPNSLYYVP